MSLLKMRTKVRRAVATVLLLLASSFTPAGARPPAPPRMDTVLYGVSYYHEYMPVERLDKDVQMMGAHGRPHPLAEKAELSHRRDQRAEHRLGLEDAVSALRRAASPQRL